MPLPPGFYTDPGDPALGPPVIQADAIDPHTGEFATLEAGLDPVDAAVLLALTTVRGSGAAVMDKGQRFKDRKFVDERASFFARTEVERALKSLVETRQVKLLQVDVLVGDDWVEVHVKYRNNPAALLRTASTPFILPEAA